MTKTIAVGEIYVNHASPKSLNTPRAREILGSSLVDPVNPENNRMYRKVSQLLHLGTNLNSFSSSTFLATDKIYVIACDRYGNSLSSEQVMFLRNSAWEVAKWFPVGDFLSIYQRVDQVTSSIVFVEI